MLYIIIRGVMVVSIVTTRRSWVENGLMEVSEGVTYYINNQPHFIYSVHIFINEK